ncbi:MAG: DUF2029 domain-containing protein [Candidatus Omnitrophota bacterium]|nr:MAG: DUF2029 domain-containing protein [Candidatus Omnitrophota bacterium]
MMAGRRPIVFLLIAIVFLSLFFRHAHRAPKRHYCDFRVYYATGARFIAKEDIYSRPQESITPYKYSPMFALVMCPLSLLSPQAASLVFFTINFILLILAFVLSRKLIVQENISFKQRVFLYVATIMMTSRFILQVLDSGQVGILILSLIIIGLYLVQREKDVLGAAFLGFAVMVKYMPVVFLPYFLVKKKFKLAFFMGLFILFYCVIPALYVGGVQNIDYMRRWLPFISQTSFDGGSWYDYKNQSLFSLVLRYFTASSPYKISIAHLTFQQGLLIACGIGLILYLLAIFPQKRSSSPNSIEYSLLFICMTLLNPNAWMHNFVVFIFVYMTLLYYPIKVHLKDRVTLILVILSFMLMSWASESLVGDNLENLFEQLSSVTIGALLLCVSLLRIKFKRISA